MRMMTVFLAIAALLFVAVAAHAELPARGTIGLYLNDGEGNDLTRSGVTKIGEPFELVVKVDSDFESAGLVFKITELNLLFPGVFKVSTWRYNETIFELGENDIGEYAFVYGGVCAPSGGVEVLRVGYADVNGDLPDDVALYVTGHAADQIHLGDLEDDPGYIDCTDGTWSLIPEPWEDDSIDPWRIEGVTHTDGLLILNPSISVPVGMESIGMLKAKF